MTAEQAESPITLRVPEAAKFLNLSRSKVYQLMETGQLTYQKIGSCRRIPREALVKLLNDCTVHARG